MANRFPIILDTNDNNRLKELPNGDSLDIANGGIRNATFIETAQLILAGTTLTPFSGSYTDLTNKPAIPTDISSITDSQNLLTGTSFATITDKPTTLSGYGITDGFDGKYTSLTLLPEFKPVATTGTFTSLTGRPTTVFGYGITDALTGTSNLADLANVNNATPTDGQLLSWDNANSYWKPITASGTGTVTSIVAGNGLTGGTITAAGTLAVNAGTGANNIIQLDANAKIPAVDGSLVTNVVLSSFNQITDVEVTTPTNGQILKYNGERWVNTENFGSGGSITFVGDDSTGTAVDGSESFKIEGGTNITTAVSGDTLTITGPNLSSYLTSLAGAHSGTFDGEVTGSVYADNSTLLVDGVSGSIPYSVLTGTPTIPTSILQLGISDGSNTHVLTTDGNGTFTFQAPGVANVGNFSFASSVMDTDDSSGITITPSVTISSDLTVQNDLVVSNKITATEFISLSAGTPEIRSATNLDLYAGNAVIIKSGTLRLYNATTTVRDAISASAGDTLYNTTLNRTQVYNGSAWVSNSLSTDIPTNTNQLTNGAGFATLASPTFTGTVSGISSTMVGLGNVTNESKATMFADPTFTGSVTGLSKSMVGLGNVTNESKATMFTDPTFTGTMAGTFEGTRQETFNITNSGSTDYTFAADSKFFPTSEDDPILYLRRGFTYNFVVNATGHPFEIRISNGGSAYNTGVTNNTQANGTIEFTVPMSAPIALYYQCTVHSGMGNTINII